MGKISNYDLNVPVIFSSLDEIIDLAVYKLIHSCFGTLLGIAKVCGCLERNGPCCTGRGSRFDEQLLQLLTRHFEVIEIGENLYNLAGIL